MIRVGVFSIRKEIADMLQRYVGGVLKDIAIVKKIDSIDEALEDTYDLYVVYTVGVVYKKLLSKIDGDRVIPVDLFPMPAGMKRVLCIEEGKILGILAGHIWDSADLLDQLIQAGIRNYRFITGTTKDADKVQADYYLVPEECMADIYSETVKSKMVVIPRSLSPKSVSELVIRTIKYNQDKLGRNHETKNIIH